MAFHREVCVVAWVGRNGRSADGMASSGTRSIVMALLLMMPFLIPRAAAAGAREFTTGDVTWMCPLIGSRMHLAHLSEVKRWEKLHAVQETLAMVPASILCCKSGLFSW